MVLLGQDGALVLGWQGWTTGCCFTVSGARPRVIGLLEAWGDSAELQGEHKSWVRSWFNWDHPYNLMENGLTAQETPTLWP